MPTMMKIKHPSPLDMEEVIADFMGKPGWRMIGTVFMNEKTIFGLKSKDAVQHGRSQYRGDFWRKHSLQFIRIDRAIL